jgi:RNA polymerase sigma factor (sigma-70 family)
VGAEEREHPMGAAEPDATGGASSLRSAAPQIPHQGGPLGAGAGSDPPEPDDSEPDARLSGDTVPEGGGFSDADLVRRMREGASGASGELYRRHMDALRRYARMCCRSSDTADDLAHEVFARTLQAVRSGKGPSKSVRAYLLTSVRHIAAAWASSEQRQQLVEDFAVFAESAGGGKRGASDAEVPRADVRAMQEAERTLVVQAFRSLSQRDQTVLWHMGVEEAELRDVAPLLGLSVDATAVAEHRARGNLRQAYLQAHVSRSLIVGGECARHADRLGPYARGALRTRAGNRMRKHLDRCERCREAAAEVVKLDERLRALVPVAFIGWFAGEGAEAAGALLTGAAASGATAAKGATTGTTATAATTPASGASTGSGAAAGDGPSDGAAVAGSAGGAAAPGGAPGPRASEGLSTPAKAGLGAVAATVAAASLVLTLVASSGEEDTAKRPQTGASPEVPSEQYQTPGREGEPDDSGSPERRDSAGQSGRDGQTKQRSASARTHGRGHAPGSSPTGAPERPPAPPHLRGYRLSQLDWGSSDPGDERPAPNEPKLRPGARGSLWQRAGISVGGTRFEHGVSVRTPSSVTISLNRSCEVYDAFAGVDDMTRRAGAVRFSVYGDGARLWSSRAIRGGQPPVRVRVPLTGVRTLRLVVTRQTPYSTGALADWAQSRIMCR